MESTITHIFTKWSVLGKLKGCHKFLGQLNADSNLYMLAIQVIAQCYVQIGDLNLTGTKIDSFRSAIWFRSAIFIPNPNPSRSEPNIFFAWCYWPCARTVGIRAKNDIYPQVTEIVIYRACARSLTAIVMYRAHMRTVLIVPETYLPCAPTVQVNAITYRAWSNVPIKNY